MIRRAFVVGVAIGVLAAPFSVEAQKPKVATVGVLAPSAARNPIHVAFEQALHQRAWVKNQNVRIEPRYSAGRPDAAPALAVELVGLGADVLVAWSAPLAIATKRAAGDVPVVFLAVGDPVGLGLVASLARPGTNATGVSFYASPEIYAKRLELLKDAVPALSRVALLMSSGTSLSGDTRMAIAGARTALNLEVREIEVPTPVDFEAGVRKAREQESQALYVWTTNPFVWGPKLSELAIEYRLPSVHWFRESAIAGGLLSYAASLTHIADRGAAYVDRILRGAKPADLPVEQPTTFELVINMKTAKALGLTIPPSLLVRADELIQ